jgi:hypothetical protein
MQRLATTALGAAEACVRPKAVATVTTAVRTRSVGGKRVIRQVQVGGLVGITVYARGSAPCIIFRDHGMHINIGLPNALKSRLYY